MSARRSHLVSRTRHNENPSPAPRSRQRNAEPASRRLTPLPPYEAPTCPLNVAAKQEIDALRATHDYTKYKRHIATSITTLTNTAGDANESLHSRKEMLETRAEKMRANGIEKTSADVEADEYANKLEKKVSDLTSKAEKALRDMIDYRDEIVMQDTIMKDINTHIPVAPAARAVGGRRSRRHADNEEEENEALEEEDEEDDFPVLSAVDLWRDAKEEYANQYSAKDMRTRYDINDYRSFKKTVHIALHGQDGSDVPHARTWFPQENSRGTADSRRSRTNTVAEEDDDDDDIVIASATTNLRCPLTLQLFVEPYSNNVCNHTFEKAAIINYHRTEATAQLQPSQGRGRAPVAVGPKRAKCPQTGCDAMLELDDFYDDPVVLRQVKRAQREAEDDDDDDEDEDIAPRGTARNRPEHINSDAMEGYEDASEQRRLAILKVKRERGQSRGVSMAPSHARQPSSEPEEDDVEIMDI